MNRKTVRRIVLIAAGVLVAVGIIAWVIWTGGDNTRKPQRGADPRVPANHLESWCSYATESNASRLIQLAGESKKTELKNWITISKEYADSTPSAVKADAREVASGIEAMKGQPAPRTVDAGTLTAAAQVDRFIAAKCTKGEQ